MTRGKPWFISLVAGLLVISNLTPSSQAADTFFDMTVPAAYGLGLCSTPTAMQCIESIEVADENGKFVKFENQEI
jgi:hypothetical protein